MQKHYRMAKVLSKLLDSQFNILGFKFGLDPIIGLIPGLGDAIGAALSFYVIWIAIGLKVPEEKIVVMIRNVLLDILIGMLPVIGDVSDFVFKANQRNWRIIEQYSPENIVEGEIVTERK